MNYDTPEKQERRMAEFVESHRENGNRPAIVRLIGGSVDDLSDYLPPDAGEPPHGARWE